MSSELFGVHFDNTIGALFIGLLVATLLSGVVWLQTYNYLMNRNFSKNDHITLRLAVVILWILDMFGLACAAKFSYSYIITNYANPEALLLLPGWTGSGMMVMETTSNFVVRSTFIYRIWRLRTRLHVLLCLIILNFITVYYCVKYEQIQLFSDLNTLKWLATVVLSMAVVSDATIAIVLCYLLSKMKSASSVKQTSRKIETLMRYSVQTGALTSTCALCILITFLAMPNNLVFLGIYLLLPRLYHNAVLASLNGRETSAETQYDNHVTVSAIAFSSAPVGVQPVLSQVPVATIDVSWTASPPQRTGNEAETVEHTPRSPTLPGYTE
ncbi:hypothetical protein C8Q75DRAFT_143437 [Abortiporus biennis]|nr:hypothetical protein C8Q75DRAFT_143437 [Abortiporus biennis]